MCDQIFFCCKPTYIDTIGNNKCKKPTYYTIITVFDQNRKYYHQINSIIHLVPQMALQAAPLIGKAKPSNSVAGSSDRYAQLLSACNFEII